VAFHADLVEVRGLGSIQRLAGWNAAERPPPGHVMAPGRRRDPGRSHPCVSRDLAHPAWAHAHISAGRLIEALEAESLQARWLPLAVGTRDLAPSEPLLQVVYKRRTMTINKSVLNQLLIELIDLPTWARAVAEVLADPDAPGAPEIIFANEANTWR
jgi:hypothetical protein